MNPRTVVVVMAVSVISVIPEVPSKPIFERQPKTAMSYWQALLLWANQTTNTSDDQMKMNGLLNRVFHGMRDISEIRRSTLKTKRRKRSVVSLGSMCPRTTSLTANRYNACILSYYVCHGLREVRCAPAAPCPFSQEPWCNNMTTTTTITVAGRQRTVQYVSDCYCSGNRFRKMKKKKLT